MNVVSKGIANLALRWIVGRRRGRERDVDPARFGIRVADPASAERIRAILGAFFSGFEAQLKSPQAAMAAAAAMDPLLQPFFHEGAAMGVLPQGYLQLTTPRRSLERFEASLEPADRFLFLRYVGLGFWLGFRFPRRPKRMHAVASMLEGARYRHLVHDGYGFKTGLFDVLKTEGRYLAERRAFESRAATALGALRELGGFARASAFNGFGRSLWFFTMDQPEYGFALARRLDADRDAILGGMGLAAAFTFPDHLGVAYRAAGGLPDGECGHFLKGIRIALYVRAANHLEFLQQSIARLAPELRARAEADLGRALLVGKETRDRQDFIEAFHRGCLGAGAIV